MRAGWRRTFAVENSEVSGGSKVSDTAKAKSAKSTNFIYTLLIYLDQGLINNLGN